MFDTIISCEQLAAQLDHPDWIIFDTRFSLSDTNAGRAMYQQGHIPRAQYLHLDDELSGTIIPGKTGRHPLPTVHDFEQQLRNWGVHHNSQVIVYDLHHGGIAARLWWMLRWLGHDAVAVLDGGWQAWEAGGLPIETTTPAQRPPGNFQASVRPDLLIDADSLIGHDDNSGFHLIDARTAPRYAGLEEPIDPVAGHIPNAINRPFLENVDADFHWRSPEELEKRFADLSDRSETPVVYCGSGVTACHNLLAMKIAGLPDGRLYPGSWSHWITDPQRPVSTK